MTTAVGFPGVVSGDLLCGQLLNVGGSLSAIQKQEQNGTLYEYSDFPI